MSYKSSKLFTFFETPCIFIDFISLRTFQYLWGYGAGKIVYGTWTFLSDQKRDNEFLPKNEAETFPHLKVVNHYANISHLENMIHIRKLPLLTFWVRFPTKKHE